MSSEKMKLAVAQMTSVDDLHANMTSVLKIFGQAKDADLVVFPENTLFFRIRSGSPLESFSLGEMNPLREAVDRGNSALMLTTAMRTEGKKFRNTTLLFEPGQAPRAVYSKVHLFDVDVAGAPSVRESEYFESGEAPSLLDFRGWKIGLSICYDVRFAELYLNYAQKADLILVPSAFLVPTGEAHWHTLLRARAIEAQAYLAAPAQAGEHSSADQVRRTYGHSLVVDPWGRVLKDLEMGDDMAIVELTKEAVARVRKQIPMEGHRRLC